MLKTHTYTRDRICNKKCFLISSSEKRNEKCRQIRKENNFKILHKKNKLIFRFFSVVCLNPIGCFNEKSKNKTKKTRKRKRQEIQF